MIEELAVISDIHGNIWALKEVLNDIKQRNITKLLNLGDCVYGPLDPAATAQILVKLNIPTVKGNEDRLVWEKSVDTARSIVLDYVCKSLNSEQINWLKLLPLNMVAYQDFFLCHGSPESDQEYLLKEVQQNRVVLRNNAELKKKLTKVKQRVILCGHDHMPRTVSLPDGTLIINPGSVGLGAYSDDYPYFHIMETGTPHARYSIIRRRGISWEVENIALPYDWEQAAAVALENGCSDWAAWLKTGRAGIKY